MKNLRKALAAVMALAVMSVSATAFADTAISFTGGAVSGSYDDANTITATVDTDSATTGTQMTFLILDNGTDVADIEESDILYIDQKELANDSNSFTGVINFARVNGAAVDATTLPEGSYPIRLGYTDSLGVFTIASATLAVEAGGGTTTIEILWGDVNQDGIFNGNDASKIVIGLTGGSTTCGDYTLGAVANGILWGDVNQDGIFNGNDASKIVIGLTGGSTTCGDYTLGQTATIEVSAE